MGKPYRTGDQTLVREINLSIILNCLRETSPLSRAQLAEITGLNKTTVSSLVRELIARQFVREIGFDSSGSGRLNVAALGGRYLGATRLGQHIAR